MSQSSDDDNDDMIVVVKDNSFSDRPPFHKSVRVGTPISEVVDMIDFEPLARDYAEVMIDGDVIPVELWAQSPAAGKHFQVVVRPEGGGDDGNKLLRTVLTLAVIVAAFYLGPQIAGALGYTQGTAAFIQASAIASSAIVTIGQLAINAIVPPPSFEATEPPEPVYFIEGQRNQLLPMQPLQTVLGTRRIVPRLASRPYPEIRGEDTYYYLIVEYGPIGVEVSDRKVGDTPLEQFDGVQYQERLVESDPHPTMASRLTTSEPVGATLGNGDWEGRRTAPDSIDCDIILTFPEGLGGLSKKGKPQSAGASIRIRYREVINPGPGETYGAWTFASVRRNSAFPEFRNFDGWFLNLENVNADNVTGDAAIFRFFEAKPQQPFFRQIGFSFPTKGTYDVEIQRALPESTSDRVFDKMVFQTLLSKAEDPPVLRDDVAYGVIMFKGTDETSGAVDEYNVLLKRLIPTFPDAVLDQPDLSGVTAADLSLVAPSSNPWCQALWCQRNGFDSRVPVKDSAINWPSFAKAAKDARDRGLKFDYVIQSSIENNELTNLIVSAGGQGRIYRFNNILEAKVDRPLPAPTHVFRDGTARNLTINKTFPVKVHGYRVTFNDAANGFRTREVVIYVDGYTKETATRIEKLPMPGIVNWDNLHTNLGQLYRNSRLQTKIATVEVPDTAVDNTLKPMSWVSVAMRTITETVASGVIREVFTSGDNVTAVRIDQELPQGPQAGDLAIKWVKENGETVSISAPERLVTPIENERGVLVQFAVAVPIAIGPSKKDEYVIGPTEVDMFEGLLDKAEEAGEGWLRLNLKSYAVSRFDETGTSIPSYQSEPVLPLGAAPPKPVFEGVTANQRETIVRFTMPDGYQNPAASFRVWRAFAPPSDDPNPESLTLFARLPNLTADERRIIDLPGDVGDRIVYRIQAVSEEGKPSPFLQTPILTVSDVLPALEDVAAVAGVEIGAGGLVKPVLGLTFEASSDPSLLAVVFEIRRVALDSGGARLPEASQPDFEQLVSITPSSGAYVARGLIGGGTYDIKAYFVGRRGEAGTETLVQNIVLAEEVPAGGGEAGSVQWGNVFGSGRPADNADVALPELGTVESRLVSAGSITANSEFQQRFSGTGVPPGWNNWNSGATARLVGSDIPGRVAARLDGLASLNAGWWQRVAVTPGRWIQSIKAKRIAGTFSGAGVHMSFRNASNAAIGSVNIPLDQTASTNGSVSSLHNGLTSWEVPFEAPPGTEHILLYTMSHWTGFGSSIANANVIDWYENSTRPAYALYDRLATVSDNADETIVNISAGFVNSGQLAYAQRSSRRRYKAISGLGLDRTYSTKASVTITTDGSPVELEWTAHFLAFAGNPYPQMDQYTVYAEVLRGGHVVATELVNARLSASANPILDALSGNTLKTADLNSPGTPANPVSTTYDLRFRHSVNQHPLMLQPTRPNPATSNFFRASTYEGDANDVATT